MHRSNKGFTPYRGRSGCKIVSSLRSKLSTTPVKPSHGFTLIELLVVIAIVGLLASVVLASLNSARAKGADATIKSSINNARSQAELYYDNNGNSYDPPTPGSTGGWLCSDPVVVNITAGVLSAGGVLTCAPTATAYRLSSPLKTSATTYYCVDSTGKATTTTSALPANSCP